MGARDEFVWLTCIATSWDFFLFRFFPLNFPPYLCMMKLGFATHILELTAATLR